MRPRIAPIEKIIDQLLNNRDLYGVLDTKIFILIFIIVWINKKPNVLKRVFQSYYDLFQVN